MTARSFEHARRGRGKASAENALANAYKRIFVDGNATRDDGEMVLADLANMSGYYRRPNYGQWMRDTKSPHGFELHSALSNARAEVVQHILDHVMLSDDQLVALEKAARAEHGR